MSKQSETVATICTACRHPWADHRQTGCSYMRDDIWNVRSKIECMCAQTPPESTQQTEAR